MRASAAALVLGAAFALAALAVKLPAPANRSLMLTGAPGPRAQIKTEYRCFNKTRRAIFSITADVMCPCLVRFKLARRQGTLSTKGTSVDFLIVGAEEAARLRNAPAPAAREVAYVSRYSVLGAKMTLASDNRFAYSSPGFEIAAKKTFALVIRYASPVRDCNIGVSYVLVQTPKRCPQRLAPPPPPTPLFALRDQPSLRVVGGDDPSDRVRRLMVSIVRAGSLVCSGSLIAPGWVLTAAHCRVRASSDVAFVAGVSGFSGSMRRVQDDVPHPNFDASKKNGPHDIALFRLVGAPVPNAQPVAINELETVPAARTYVRITGYGRISEDFQTARAPSLRTVDLPVWYRDHCESAYDVSRVNLPYPLDSTRQLCAGYRDKGACDACQGDSGGPALGYERSGEPVQVAIVSYGMGCARGGIPGVYTRIAPYVAWIRSITSDVALSRSTVEVSAGSLHSNVTNKSPSSGLGYDGIRRAPLRLDTNNDFNVRGADGKAVRLLKFIIPSAIAVFGGFLLCCACIIGCLATRRRDKLTQSDHATGMYTASIQGPQSEFGIASTTFADSDGLDAMGGPNFSDSDQSIDMQNSYEIELPSNISSHPVARPPAVTLTPFRRLFGRRQRPEEIVRMPEIMISAGGGADTFEDDPIVELQPAPSTPKRVRIVDMNVEKSQETLGSPFFTSPLDGDLNEHSRSTKRSSRRSNNSTSPSKHEPEPRPSVPPDIRMMTTLHATDNTYSTSPLDGDLQSAPNIKRSSKRSSKRMSSGTRNMGASSSASPTSGRADVGKRRRSGNPEDGEQLDTNVVTPVRTSAGRKSRRSLDADSPDQLNTDRHSSKRSSKRVSSSRHDHPFPPVPDPKEEERLRKNVAAPARTPVGRESRRPLDAGAPDLPNTDRRNSKRSSKRVSSGQHDHPSSLAPVGGPARSSERIRSRNFEVEAENDTNLKLPGRKPGSESPRPRDGDSLDQPNNDKRSSKRSSKRRSKRGSSSRHEIEHTAPVVPSNGQKSEERRRSRRYAEEEGARHTDITDELATDGLFGIQNFTEVVPERTTSRPILQFHEDLVHGFVER